MGLRAGRLCSLLLFMVLIVWCLPVSGMSCSLQVLGYEFYLIWVRFEHSWAVLAFLKSNDFKRSPQFDELKNKKVGLRFIYGPSKFKTRRLELNFIVKTFKYVAMMSVTVQCMRVRNSNLYIMVLRAIRLFELAFNRNYEIGVYTGWVGKSFGPTRIE